MYNGWHFIRISSPNWPDYYDHTQICTYTITAPEGFGVLLYPYIKMSADLETSCKYTYLEVRPLKMIITYPVYRFDTVHSQ